MGPVEEIRVPFGDENDDNVSEAANANFDHDRELDPIESNPNLINNCTTGPQVGPAKEEKIGRRLFLSTVRAEQREKFLRSLVVAEVGTNRVESNQLRAREELNRDSGRLVKDIVAEMERKTEDARRDAKESRNCSNKWRKKVETSDQLSKGQVQKMIGKLKKESSTLRENLKMHVVDDEVLTEI